MDAHVKGKKGGTGKTFNWDIAVKAKEYGMPVILAGGLTPENIAEAVIKVDPYGVDTSSGVEISPGVKDHKKVKEFIETSRTPSVLLRIVEKKKAEVKALDEIGLSVQYRKGAIRDPGREFCFYKSLTAPRIYQSPHLIAEKPDNSKKHGRKNI